MDPRVLVHKKCIQNTNVKETLKLKSYWIIQSSYLDLITNMSCNLFSEMSENLRVKVDKKAFLKCLVKFPPPGHFIHNLVVCEVLVLEVLLTLLSIQNSIKSILRHLSTSLRKNYLGV